ncbi:hypothetical protein [Priestia megaterium]|uniref:hypothetical protein n=1 Tax=Priestia megaterium TaxID=1404 RepID=UPI0038732F10|nr:hypothetical protein QY062_24545 [Priestia megaterium]
MITGNLRYLFFVSNELDQFRNYAEYIESSLRKEVKSYVDRAEGLLPEEAEEFWEWHLDEVSPYSQDFPKIMRNSLFVSIYTFLEDKIVELCVSDKDTLLELSDIKGQGIHQASIYLKKVLRIDFPDNSKEWQYIKKANLIRNCIVHSSGDVSKSRNETKLRNAVQDMPSISIDKMGYINLNDELCIDFIENVDLFLKQLYAAVYKVDV